MLFSLRELVGSLTPGGESQGVYFVCLATCILCSYYMYIAEIAAFHVIYQSINQSLKHSLVHQNIFDGKTI